jgi:hypothetical protein
MSERGDRRGSAAAGIPKSRCKTPCHKVRGFCPNTASALNPRSVGIDPSLQGGRQGLAHRESRSDGNRTRDLRRVRRAPLLDVTRRRPTAAVTRPHSTGLSDRQNRPDRAEISRPSERSPTPFDSGPLAPRSDGRCLNGQHSRSGCPTTAATCHVPHSSLQRATLVSRSSTPYREDTSKGDTQQTGTTTLPGDHSSVLLARSGFCTPQVVCAHPSRQKIPIGRALYEKRSPEVANSGVTGRHDATG